MKFILIMTIYFWGPSARSVNIEAVEFNNKESCLAAGQAWESKNKKLSDELNYLCVAKGAEK